MRIMASLAMSLVVSTTLLPGSQTKYEDKITVFVRGATTADGFTDPSKDHQDSIKDLRRSLGMSPEVRPVSTEQEAIVILDVLGRETKREANAWTGLSGHKQNKSYLTARLIAGDFSAEFTGESGSNGVLKNYSGAAGKIVKQLDAWVKVNRDRLLLLKKSSIVQ